MTDEELRAACERMVAWEYGKPTPGMHGFQAMARRLLELLPRPVCPKCLGKGWTAEVKRVGSEGVYVTSIGCPECNPAGKWVMHL